MLCSSGELEYLNEPFNASIWPRKLGVRLGGHYTYVCRENECAFTKPVERLLRYRPPLASQIPEIRSVRDVARITKAGVLAARARLRKRRPLFKDPIALFAAPWLAERFGMNVVVMIRHPAAYVSSIRRLDWNFNFGYLLEQKELMRDYLEPFRGELERHAAHPADPFDQAITLWRIKYSVVDQWRIRYPNWQFVRYEDLASNPIEGFRNLFDGAGLRFDDNVRATIQSFTNAQNPGERPTAEYKSVRRDSRSMNRVWCSRLTPAEVIRIRDAVGPIADRFYSNAEWID